MAATQPKTVQSVLRAMDLLELLARSEQPMALRELAERAGLKAPTAHHLLGSLVARGMARKVGSPARYASGPRLRELADLHWHRALLGAAERELTDLAARAPAGTFCLAEPVGEEVLATLRASADRPGVVLRPRADAMHPWGGATALLFQALWPAERRQAYRAAHPFWRHGAHVWADEDEADAFCREVREIALAVPPISSFRLFRAAAPVCDAGGDIVAAVGSAAKTDELTDAQCMELIEHTRAAAAACGEALTAD